MSRKSLNLLHNRQTFFQEKLHDMQAIISDYKKNTDINNYTEADLKEVTRGKSYALFPELNNLSSITLFDLKDGLVERGITDTLFQNKVMHMVLQSRAGLQFGLGGAIAATFMEQGAILRVDQDATKQSLKIKSSNEVEFRFNFTYRQMENKNSLVKANLVINITPERTVLSKLNIVSRACTPELKSVMQNLKQCQASLLERIKAWFKRQTGFTLESSSQHYFRQSGSSLQPIAIAEGEQNSPALTR